MNKPWDRTAMGGAASRFHTTQWSNIHSARTTDETRRQLILEDLIETYWKPVYCYLRRKGCGNETAKDLTQAFFSEIVLGRDLLRKADRAKGKFRTLLVLALERYYASYLRGQGRIKRGGKARIVSLDVPHLENLPIVESMAGPVQAFHYGWITELLDATIAEVKHEYRSTQRSSHWDSFQLKVLDPIVDGVAPPSLKEIAEQCGIANEAKVSNMIITVKRRFRAILRRRVRTLMRSDVEIEEEFADLFRFLDKKGAG
jgi:DNA-directed RNA polymerase specialized sigma24 family protein